MVGLKVRVQPPYSLLKMNHNNGGAGSRAGLTQALPVMAPYGFVGTVPVITLGLITQGVPG